VDTLDFPLNPPDAEDTSGGSDFGVYRDRYEKYHAGEDWGFRDEPNFGKPVYSIGHGFVTYAAPNGWGLDRGVVVIRHIFSNGDTFLSFYGHLDPPSVTLTTGECVTRGEKIGEIGRPRTPPHLHFEIRTHLPNSAGTGYWPTDPRDAGWLPPSQTISAKRLEASLGMLWARTYTDGLTKSLGILGDDFMLVHDHQIQALDPYDGSIRWSQLITDTIKNAVLDADLAQVYLFDLKGALSANPLTASVEPIWTVNLKAMSAADLLPIPGGGVIVADRQRAIALDTDGAIHWEAETHAPVLSWTQVEGGLLLATSDTEKPLWFVNLNGAAAWNWRISGTLVNHTGRVYLHADDGLYQLDIEQRTGFRVVPLPRGKPSLGDLVSLTNGGLLLIHTDGYDRRLIAFNPDHSVKWERSIKNFTFGKQQLAIQGDSAYLLWAHSTSTGNQINIYAIDLESATLTHILAAGTRISYSNQNLLDPISDRLLFVNVGAGPLGMLDAQEALAVVLNSNHP
jgi:outer membrane protein assembly factor BamB